MRFPARRPLLQSTNDKVAAPCLCARFARVKARSLFRIESRLGMFHVPVAGRLDQRFF